MRLLLKPSEHVLPYSIPPSLPNAVAPIIVGMVLCLPNAIMLEATLSF